MALSYKEIVEKLDEIQRISSKIEKTLILIDLLKKSEESEYLVLFILGRVFPEYMNKELGVSQNLLLRALSKAYGYSTDELERMWKEKGDIGKVAEEVSLKRKQSSLMFGSVSLRYIIETLRNVGQLEGEGSIDKKILLISGLFMKVKGKEAKYLARYILGDMRIGVAEGLIRDAIIGAYFSQIYWASLLDNAEGITQNLMMRY